MTGVRSLLAGIGIAAATAGILLGVAVSVAPSGPDVEYSDVETYTVHLQVRGVSDPEARGGFRVCDMIRANPDVSYPTLLAAAGPPALPAAAVVVDAALTHLCPWLWE